MRQLPPDPIFTRSEARACGWSDSALTRAISSGKVIRHRRGMLAAAQPGSPSALDPAARALAGSAASPAASPASSLASSGILARYSERDARLVLAARAAARSCQGSVVSHGSAALFHQLPLLRVPDRPCVTVAPTATGDLSGAHLHRATLHPDDVIEGDGVLLTSAARTVIDIARSSSRAGALMAIDSALNRRLTSAAALEAVLLRCWNWPRIARATRACGLADPRSESALESVSRLVLGWLDIPTPDLQRTIRTRLGRFIGRVDFYWDEFGVVGEADGAVKYRSQDRSLLTEKRRQERLENAGLVVVRWDWSEATRQPSALRERIWAAFERAATRDRSGSPRGWSI